MRKPDHQQPRLFYSFCPESLIPEDHPLRAIKRMVEESLKALDDNLQKCTHLMAGPVSLPKGCSKDCCCKSYLPSAVNERSWNTSDSTFYTAGLLDLTCKTPSGTPRLSPKTATGLLKRTIFAPCAVHNLLDPPCEKCEILSEPSDKERGYYT